MFCCISLKVWQNENLLKLTQCEVWKEGASMSQILRWICQGWHERYLDIRSYKVWRIQPLCKRQFESSTIVSCRPRVYRYLLSAAKEIMSQLKTEWGEYSRDLQSFYVQFKNESDDIIWCDLKMTLNSSASASAAMHRTSGRRAVGQKKIAL